MSLTKVSYSMIKGSIVSPDDYGAVSYTGLYSGQPDASSAINAAIAACPDGGTVALNGKYFINAPVILSSRNITFSGGTLEVLYTYTDEAIIIRPNPPTPYDIIGCLLKDTRIQTTGRELPSGNPNQATWYGDYIGIKIESAERAVVWNNIENIYISNPNIGIKWGQNTVSPSVNSGYTTCMHFRGINIEGAIKSIYVQDNAGLNIYSGKVFGNTFTGCAFSSRAASTAFLTQDSYTEFEFSNCVFFNDGSPNMAFMAGLGGSRIRITGGYWEIQPHNFTDFNTISTANIRIVPPNNYPGSSAGYTTTLPFFSGTDSRYNYIQGQGVNGFTEFIPAAGATLIFASTFWNSYWVFNFATNATPGILVYDVLDPARFGYNCNLIFSLRLKQSVIGSAGWSIYARVTYADTTAVNFLSQQSPSTTSWETVAVAFKTDPAKQVSGISLVVQGTANETAQICAPMLTIGTAIPIYPEPTNSATSILQSLSPSSTGLHIYNSSTGNPLGIVIDNTVVASTTGAYLTAQDTGGVRARIKGNGDLENVNGVYGTISDIRIKENIADSASFLDDLMKIRIINYNLISDEKKIKLLGSIAQEVEEVFPRLVYETQEYKQEKKVEFIDGEPNIKTIDVPVGNPIKAIKYSIFVPMLIKAVQELNEKITRLENK